MGIGVNRRTGLALLGATALLPAAAVQDLTDGDPLGSMQWPTLHKEFIGDAAWSFSEQVQVRGPNFADDAMNVPLMVDARQVVASGQVIKRIRVVVDRNPVRHVLDFEPLKSLPVIAFRIRMEQASPVRALVELGSGQWLVGSTWVEAAGGGCTVPGLTRADGSWSRTLGQVQARFFSNVLEGSRRLRLRVMHPMDTGLVAGTPAFYIEDLTLKDAAGQAWWHLSLHEPVSENPLLTLEMPSSAPRQFHLSGRDNGGNLIEAEVGV
ncbi:quinoprotein dehydrogenase-associated SoxYZ-like carrier [Hydrogenophaga sp. 5NK40-0174]|uniref:quinoprotein dehydrogenase-associated SoxYZ-like carrier n=1 Tax=Hydrogenophaga sp. 5NK40-0174 TaxID=3127649 RepID=UPI0031025FFA